MTLILCCGNPLRGDDAVGWCVAERLGGEAIRTRIVACHALVPEFAPAIAAAKVVVFVDAFAGGTPGEVHCTRIHAATAPAPPRHGETPESLLALANALYPGRPVAYLITIAAAQFEMGAPLSPAVADAVPRVVALIESFAAQVVSSSCRVRNEIRAQAR
jgi:hydrogenase maturation protease